MENRMYNVVALLSLTISAACIGSEDTAKAGAVDFNELQAQMSVYENHAQIPSFFSWEYWSPSRTKAYRFSDYYEGIQKLENDLKSRGYEQQLATREMVARKQKLARMHNFWRPYGQLEIVDIIYTPYSKTGYVVAPYSRFK